MKQYYRTDLNTLKVIFESHLSILFKFLKYIVKGSEWNNTIFAELNKYDELNLNNIFLSAETIDEYYIEINRNHYQISYFRAKRVKCDITFYSKVIFSCYKSKT